MTRPDPPREVRHVELRCHIRYCNPISIDTTICTCSGTLRSQPYLQVIPMNRHPPKLDVAEKHHPTRPPILQRVGEHIDVHEGTPTLASTDLSDLSPCMAQTNCGLPSVYASSE